MECDRTLRVAAHASCVSTGPLTSVCTHSPCVFVHACVSVIEEKKIGYAVVVGTHMEAWLRYVAVDGWQRARCSNCSLLSSTQQPLFSLFTLVLVSSLSLSCSLYVFPLQSCILCCFFSALPVPPSCVVSGCHKVHRKPH